MFATGIIAGLGAALLFALLRPWSTSATVCWERFRAAPSCDAGPSEQLLTLARTEPDAAMALAGEPVGLVDVVGQAVADHALVAEAKRVDLGAKHAADDAVVLGDPAALRTLLANLVDNAIRHARAEVALRTGGSSSLAVSAFPPSLAQTRAWSAHRSASGV